MKLRRPQRARWGEMRVKAVITVLMWLLAVVCILAMKKIEPDNKAYPVWTVFVMALFTLFTIYTGLG